MPQEERPHTLGELKKSGYQVLPIREEMQRNLIRKMSAGEALFAGIIGYGDTVIPQLENAILAGQDIVLLGERGQAKTRLLRGLIQLLDEYTPIIEGVEIPENPYDPISAQARALVAEQGDDTPISWLHRDQRYGEKLATPDITVADLIGEVDPIKVAEGRYLSDELTLHYGLIPKTNRGIFAINELPDLAERIQVGLLNIMEERDIQIRGHKVRLPLDLLVVATANPEDYTNRGRIITPLKDRFGSQIRTHYPIDRDDEVRIMEQEYKQASVEGYSLQVPEYMKQIVVEVSQTARKSPDISQRSGVSVRASIANYENLIANALRRAIRLKDNTIVPRISDLPFLVPALAGKIEFEVLEEDQEDLILQQLFENAVKQTFENYFSLEELEPFVEAFNSDTTIDTGEALHSGFYEDVIGQIPGLGEAVTQLTSSENLALRASAVEFILEGLYVNNRLSKDAMQGQFVYRA
ncbi:MAG: magnesium chelatase [Gammaproteobacteria bacterium]|nr:MAG: magnesium chelatase [Gammaproteobacteria bacterium]